MTWHEFRSLSAKSDTTYVIENLLRAKFRYFIPRYTLYLFVCKKKKKKEVSLLMSICLIQERDGCNGVDIIRDNGKKKIVIPHSYTLATIKVSREKKERAKNVPCSRDFNFKRSHNRLRKDYILSVCIYTCTLRMNLQKSIVLVWINRRYAHAYLYPWLSLFFLCIRYRSYRGSLLCVRKVSLFLFTQSYSVVQSCVLRNFKIQSTTKIEKKKIW